MSPSLTKFNIEYEIILPGWDEFNKSEIDYETIFAYTPEEAEDIFYRLNRKHCFIMKITKDD